MADHSLERLIQQKQSAYHNEFELQKENDFLHLRLQQLSKDVLQFQNLKKTQVLYQEKLEFYEAVIEEITTENTKLVLQLDTIEKLESERDRMVEKIE